MRRKHFFSLPFSCIRFYTSLKHIQCNVSLCRQFNANLLWHVFTLRLEIGRMQSPVTIISGKEKISKSTFSRKTYTSKSVEDTNYYEYQSYIQYGYLIAFLATRLDSSLKTFFSIAGEGTVFSMTFLGAFVHIIGAGC